MEENVNRDKALWHCNHDSTFTDMEKEKKKGLHAIQLYHTSFFFSSFDTALSTYNQMKNLKQS